MRIKTYLWYGIEKLGWEGYGTAECPHCGYFTDIGTGEHAIPGVAECGQCGKQFRYWPSGRTRPVSERR